MEEVGRGGGGSSRLITGADTWAGAREAGERPALRSSPQLRPALAKPAPIWASQAGREEGTGNNTGPSSAEGPLRFGCWRPRRSPIAYCVSAASAALSSAATPWTSTLALRLCNSLS